MIMTRAVDISIQAVSPLFIDALLLALARVRRGPVRNELAARAPEWSPLRSRGWAHGRPGYVAGPVPKRMRSGDGRAAQAARISAITRSTNGRIRSWRSSQR